MKLAEILKINALTGQPTIECHSMPCLDVDDSDNVLLGDQRADSRSEERHQWPDGATGERHGALLLIGPANSLMRRT